MMIIKFRGQNIKTTEWVYGNLIKMDSEGSQSFIFPFYEHASSLSCSQLIALNMIAIIPETVGQFTGLLDKNDKEIYEGDVVFDRWANAYTPVFQNGIYMAYNPKNLMQNDPSTQFNIIWKNGCEVIGNIHERSEV